MRRQAELAAPPTTSFSFTGVRALDKSGISGAPFDCPQKALGRPLVVGDGIPLGPLHLPPRQCLGDSPVILCDLIETAGEEHADAAEPLTGIV